MPNNLEIQRPARSTTPHPYALHNCVLITFLLDAAFGCRNFWRVLDSPIVVNGAPFAHRYIGGSLLAIFMPLVGLCALARGQGLFRAFAIFYLIYKALFSVVRFFLLFASARTFWSFLQSITKQTAWDAWTFGAVFLSAFNPRDWQLSFQSGGIVLTNNPASQQDISQELRDFRPSMERPHLKTIRCSKCQHDVNIPERYRGEIVIPAHSCLYCGQELPNE